MGGIGPAGPIVGDSEQQFALKWNDYHTSILNSFKVLRDQKDFIDVTIACDNMSFNAHKVVLSACSPYFRSLLKANPCQHPIVILHNVREHDMEALLRFMYNGEVHIGQEQLPDFLRTATALQVRGLADVSPKNRQNLSNIHAVPWSTGDENNSQSLYNSKHNLSVDNLPPSKKHRTSENPDSRYSESPPVNRDSGSENADGKPSSLSDSVLSQSQGDVSQSAQNSHAVLKTVSEPSSQVQSSNEEESDYDDEASDAEVDNGHSSISDLAQASDFAMNERSRNDALSSGLYDQQRQRSNFPLPFNLQNLSDIAGLIPGLSGMHNNSQDSYGGGSSSSASYSGLVEPKPVCKECGRVYSSISNLKQHIANVHSTAPQWELCAICGKHFKTKQYLFNHLLQTHGIRQRGNRMPIMPFGGSGYTSPHHHHNPASTPSSPGVSHSGLSQLSQSSSSISLTRVGSSAPPMIFPSPPPPPPPTSLIAPTMSPSSSMPPPPPVGAAPMVTSVPISTAASVGPHSPMETSIDRTMPHQVTPAAIGQKDREMSSAVEQCMQHYLSK